MLLYGPRQPRQYHFESIAGAAEARRLVRGLPDTLPDIFNLLLARQDKDPSTNIIILIDGLADSFASFDQLAWCQLGDNLRGLCQTKGLALLAEHLDIYFDGNIDRLCEGEFDFIVQNKDTFHDSYRRIIDLRPAFSFSASERLDDNLADELRSDVYRRLFDSLGQPAVINYQDWQDIFLSDRDVVLEDLASGETDLHYLPAAIELACRDNGLTRFAGQDLSGEEARQWLSALDDDYLSRCEIALRSFTLSAKQEVVVYNQTALGVDAGSGIERRLSRLSADLPRAIIEGRGDLLLESWRQDWLDLIIDQIKPRSFGDWPPSLVDPDKSLELFYQENLARLLLPDRRLQLSDVEWREVLVQSLRRRRENPLALYIDRARMAASLQRIYNRRRQNWIVAPEN